MDDKSSSKPTFGSANLAVSTDDQGIVTIRFDSKRVVARAGELKGSGKPRKQDMITTGGGWLNVGTCAISLNVMRSRFADVQGSLD